MERVTRMGLLLALLAVACAGGGATGTDDATADEAPADTLDATGDGERVPVQVTEDFRLVFPYLRYTTAPLVDVFFSDPAAGSASETSLSDRIGQVAPGVDCSSGCLVDATGRWLAVVVAGPAAEGQGSTVRLFRLAAGPVVTPSTVSDVTDVTAMAFGDDALYFSRPRAACEAERGPSRGCHAFYRTPLSAPGAEEFLFTFPTAAALQTAMPHSGRFVMGQDGRTVVVLAPTTNTQSAWVWRTAGEPIRVAGPLCGVRGGTDGGTCVGSGSAYSDADPVALSPDGRHLALALVLHDQDLVLGHMDLQGDGTLETATLLHLPDDVTDFAMNACYNRTPRDAPWQPTSVQAPLRFSRDGTEVVFVGRAACGANKDKPWTNLLAVPLARIDQGGTLQRGDLRWITEFPSGAIVDCVSILPAAMDLSPSGDFVVFAGTPRFDSAGQLLLDSQLQHFQDAEVWITRRDGTTEPAQLTARQGWRATSVQAVPVPAP
jgi:hypothetical protein